MVLEYRKKGIILEHQQLCPPNKVDVCLFFGTRERVLKLRNMTCILLTQMAPHGIPFYFSIGDNLKGPTARMALVVPDTAAWETQN